MVHLSEVLRLPAFDLDGSPAGRLADLQVDPVSYLVEHVVLRTGRTMSLVAWDGVDDFSPENRRMTLAEGATAEPAAPGDADVLRLRRDVLDRQIIDIRGRKVVKVNDLALRPVGDRLRLVRVEVGLAGAARRLLVGLVSPRLVRRVAEGLPARGIPWDYVGLVEGGGIRLKVHQQLAKMHPADLADILEDLGRVERGKFVASLDPETIAQAISEAEPAVQAAVMAALQVDQAADLLEEMPPDEAADILGDLPEERSRQLLAAMEEDDAEDVRELLRFREDSAGGLMTTEYFAARADWSVDRTIRALREVDEDLLGDLDEIPVVGEENHLVGVVPLVRLVRAPAERRVTEVMRSEARAVTPATPFEEVVERFEKYHLRALAVVDEFGELVGLINVEDVFSRLAEGD